MHASQRRHGTHPPSSQLLFTLIKLHAHVSAVLSLRALTPTSLKCGLTWRPTASALIGFTRDSCGGVSRPRGALWHVQAAVGSRTNLFANKIMERLPGHARTDGLVVRSL